jgi:hypothetical protein
MHSLKKLLHKPGTTMLATGNYEVAFLKMIHDASDNGGKSNPEITQLLPTISICTTLPQHRIQAFHKTLPIRKSSRRYYGYGQLPQQTPQRLRKAKKTHNYNGSWFHLGFLVECFAQFGNVVNGGYE